MMKDQIIQEAEGILKELVFLIGIHVLPEAICFNEAVVEFMKELDEKQCDWLKARLVEYKQAEILKRSIRASLKKGEEGEAS